MAVSYAGLTIEFGGDTTGLSDALKKIQGEAKTTNADLKAIEKSLKFHPGNTDLLAQKVRNLNKAFEDTKAKLDAYKQAMSQLEDKKKRGEELTEQEARQYEQLQRSILQAEDQLESIEGDIKSTSDEFEASKTSIYQWGQTLEDNADKFKAIGGGMKKVGDAATKGITLPLIGVATAATKTAVDVDTSLTGVRKTLSASEEEYKALKDAAIAFSETNAVSATQLLDIEALGAQLGYTLDVMSNGKTEVQEFGEVVAGLDIATNMSAEQAGTELAQFANITKMAKEDTSNYASTIVALGNNLATTEGDVSSMAMRLAAAGSQVGMSQADILGLAGALTSMGVEAEAGGSALSTIMSQIDKDVASGTEAVEAWASAAGMTADEFANAWRSDPVTALSALLSGMESATAEGGNMSIMLEELGIDSIRQTDIMKRLAGNSEVLADSVDLANTAWQENTALTDEVNNKNDSAAAKFEILKNRLAGVLERIGGPLVDALTDALTAAEPLLDTIADLAQKFADADEDDQRFILGVAAAAAGFGPLLSGAGSLVTNLGALGTGMKTASTLFASLTGASGTAATAVGGVGTAAGGLSGAWGAMTGFISANPIALGVGVVAAAAAGLTWFFTQTETGRQMWSDFTGWISEKWQGVKDFLGGIPDWWGGVTSGIATWNEDMRQDMSTKWEDIKTAVSDKAKSIRDDVSNYWRESSERVATWNEDVRQKAADKWSEIKTAVGDKARSLKEDVSNYWQESSQKAATWNEQTRQKALDKWSEIKTGVSDKAQAIRTAISDKFSAAKEKAISIFDNIRQGIKDKINAARDAVSEAIRRIKEKFNFSWSLPKLKLPHISITGSFSLNPPSTPHFGINWYANGGAIAPNNPHLIGVGDSHEREWLEPESKLIRLMEDAVRRAGSAGGNVTVEVNVNACITGTTSAYQLGQSIGRGVQSTLKQTGRAMSYA